MPSLMLPPGVVERHAADLIERKPLLEMTADELIQAYMSPLTLGVYLSFFLYGLFILSLFMYFAKFRRDTWLNRIVVILLACFTTVDTVSGGVRIFRITVLHPNNLAYVLDVTQRPEDWICTLFLLCTILLSQLFLCFRILSFARKMSDWAGPRARVKMGLMAGSLGLVWLACLGVSIANCVVFYKTQNYLELLLPTSPLAWSFRKTSLLMPCVLCIMDIMIAIIMTIQYRKAKTGYGDSNRILEVLITVVVRNGVLIAVVMVIQFVVTLTAVLWGNFLPLCYGKLHALTVLCILTEPRLAHSKYNQNPTDVDHENAGPVHTPHMDYTRPSQLATISAGYNSSQTAEVASRRRKPRRYSTSSFESRGRRRSDLLPYDGDGYEYDDSQAVRSRDTVRSGKDERGGQSDSTLDKTKDYRPGLMGRKISEAPTASSGNTALNPGTPVYELKSGDVELGPDRGDVTVGDGLVVQIEEKEELAGSFLKPKDKKEQGQDEDERKL